jgi:WhiB family redox-sensing transcriptional regulator
MNGILMTSLRPQVSVDTTTLIRLVARRPGGWTEAAACRGTDFDYHPEKGAPEPEALQLCSGCRVRHECLAEALALEEPDARQGWWGGFAPDERDEVAGELDLVATEVTLTERVAKLTEQGLSATQIARQLGYSRRHVLRHRALATPVIARAARRG